MEVSAILYIAIFGVKLSQASFKFCSGRLEKSDCVVQVFGKPHVPLHVKDTVVLLNILLSCGLDCWHR